MIRQTLISLAVVAALGSTATLNAKRQTAAPHVAVADSTQKKTETVQPAAAVAAQAGKGAVAKTKKAVAEAHKVAAQRRQEQKQKQQAKAAVGDEAAADEMVAYSDTTSAAAADDAANGGASRYKGNGMDETNLYDPARFTDPFSWFAYLSSTSFSGILITLFSLLLLFLFLVMPFIAFFMVLRYIVRRHKDRVRLAEMAIRQGHPLTAGQMDFELRPRSYMWRKGVKNLSVGIGLMIFFLFLGVEPLAGIGALVACMGAGKMFMARYDYGMKRRGDTPADGEFLGEGMDGKATDSQSASQDTAQKAAWENEENPQGHGSAAE